MADRFLFKLTGDRRTQRIIDSLGLKGGKLNSMIARSARPGAKIIQQRAKSLAPSSRGTFRSGKKKGQTKPGTLTRSIKVRVIPSRKAKVRSGARVRIHADAIRGYFYPAPQEYGWYPHGNKSNERVSAKNFLLRASQQASKPALSSFRSKFREELEKFAAKARTKARAKRG